MPLLGKQPDIYPANLLDEAYLSTVTEGDWWVLATKPRTEKKLLTWLAKNESPHYCPLIEKRYRSPNGRLRTSYIPAFSGYLFLLGNEEQRYQALTSNFVIRNDRVKDPVDFLRDLRQIHTAIVSGVPLTPESRLVKGDRVVVKSGPFRGYEGIVIRREHETRLLLSLNFIEQGVSMVVDEAQLAPI